MQIVYGNSRVNKVDISHGKMYMAVTPHGCAVSLDSPPDMSLYFIINIQFDSHPVTASGLHNTLMCAPSDASWGFYVPPSTSYYST